MDLIQANGQPRYGRFAQLPSSINLEGYEYKTPYGEVLQGWRKRLKYKKFKFCSIQHEQYSIGLAIVDLGWAGHGFFYIYNHENGQVQEWNATRPLGYKTHLDEQPLYNQSYFYKSPFAIEIQHANGVRYIRITRHGEIKLTARIFCAGTQPLSLCSPNGINGWTYTQKQTTLAIEGYFINQQKQSITFNEHSFAALDDTCGFLRPETAWFWLSCSFCDQQQRRIGLNLASGVNESFGNENSLWVNGTLYALSDVLFEQLDTACWRICSLDQQLDLNVQTSWRRYENINLRMVGSQFSQWQACISGTVQTPQGECIRLKQEFGLLEQHYAKW